jgi:NAD-dependent deacetylase
MGNLFSGLFEIEVKETDIGIKPLLENTVEEAANLLLNNRGKVVFITGAGISASQLPTFRSNDNAGLWGVLPSLIMSKSQFYQNPLPSWRIAANVRNLQLNGTLKHCVAHNIAHKLVADGYVSKIITQNCDSLHTYSDKYDKDVIELHGVVNDTGDCERCNQMRHVDVLQILNHDKCPLCPVCGATLKPPIAFFEDIIPRSVREEAYKALNSCDVLFIIGTYCAVDPVLSMVSSAKRNGTILIEINPEESNGSKFMDICLRGKADDVLTQIADIIYPGLDFN